MGRVLHKEMVREWAAHVVIACEQVAHQEMVSKCMVYAVMVCERKVHETVSQRVVHEHTVHE